MPIDVPYSMLVRDGDIVWTRGYDHPGPASTGLPVVGLSDRRSLSSVDVLAGR